MLTLSLLVLTTLMLRRCVLKSELWMLSSEQVVAETSQSSELSPDPCRPWPFRPWSWKDWTRVLGSIRKLTGFETLKEFLF